MNDNSHPAEKIALVFDWGNTLMKVFPEYSGPMADWPEVAEVEGVGKALDGLVGQYPMVVATNAADSTAELVWEALKRAKLDAYFKAVFTSHELGSKKPSTHFYRALESVLDHPAYQCVMIGDDYSVDILGAKAAGWRAVWFNPGFLAAPALLPMQDAEIHGMNSLQPALARLSLPDYATCLNWLVARGTPYNILTHIQLVASIAYQLAVWLAEKGETVDPVLTQRGAMLHDLAKIDSIGQGKERGPHGDHAAMARDLLLERGQPELAEIANRHMPYQDPQDPRRPITWEQRLTHYADKLAEGSRLVSIDDRLLALKGRYPKAANELEKSWPVLAALQQEICDRLETTPDKLVQSLHHSLGFR